MENLATFLAPIVWCMEQLFNMLITAVDSVGISILLLSCIFTFALWPLSRYCELIEKKTTDKMAIVGEAEALIDPNLKGEARFNSLEAIYKKHKYHPISSVLLGARFFVALPVLLSAIVVMSNSSQLIGEPFLFIKDLSLPDQFFQFGALSLNLMPILMLTLTIFDALVRYKNNKSARFRFYAISLLLFVLVYTLPSGLILYWIGANAISFLVYWFKSRPSTD